MVPAPAKESLCHTLFSGKVDKHDEYCAMWEMRLELHHQMGWTFLFLVGEFQVRFMSLMINKFDMIYFAFNVTDENKRVVNKDTKGSWKWIMNNLSNCSFSNQIHTVFPPPILLQHRGLWLVVCLTVMGFWVWILAAGNLAFACSCLAYLEMLSAMKGYNPSHHDNTDLKSTQTTFFSPSQEPLKVHLKLMRSD